MGSNGGAWDPKDLCLFDDLATGLILDPQLQFVTHKMNTKYRAERKSWSPIRSILAEFQLMATDLGIAQYRQTFNRLRTEVPKWWKQFENETDDKKKKIQDHIYLYLKMWDPNSGYTIKECLRYSKDGIDGRGGSLHVSMNYKKGENISELKGCIAPMTPEQAAEILFEGQNDYSVQYSMNRRKSQLWLGPAAFLNHDCKPNAKIESTGPHTASVFAITDIKCDDELLIFYGKEFFGPNNCECECFTCERRLQGKFGGSNPTRTSPLKVLAGSKYGLRETASRKRRLTKVHEITSEDVNGARSSKSRREVVDIRIEKRKTGKRTERVTQVTLRERCESTDSDQPRNISLKFKNRSINVNFDGQSSE